MLEQIFCPYCESAQQVVDAQQGQNQYVKCGINVSPCCSGEQASNYEIDGVINYKKNSEISVASGVIIDSNANHEFNENYIKAKALMDLYK